MKHAVINPDIKHSAEISMMKFLKLLKYAEAVRAKSKTTHIQMAIIAMSLGLIMAPHQLVRMQLVRMQLEPILEAMSRCISRKQSS
jgi:uncharacterized membrane protein YbaN (DUF454 family)